MLVMTEDGLGICVLFLCSKDWYCTTVVLQLQKPLSRIIAGGDVPLVARRSKKIGVWRGDIAWLGTLGKEL